VADVTLEVNVGTVAVGITKLVETNVAFTALSIMEPYVGEHTEVEHESRAQKRRARRKRARDSARKLRRSLRLKEKEEPGFELPEDKAARVQQAKFDFSGASRRLRNILSNSYLTSPDFYVSDDTESLLDIAAACG
jgi:Fe-S cluster assembly ATPase SufC